MRQQVGRVSLFLQYDIYHMQRADTLVDMSRERVKSTTVFLFEHLNRLGYDGWIVK
jgi:hydroxypyruvate isomerase